MPGTVVVVGAINADLVVTLDRLPAPGETVIGGRVARHGGGKGANQAVAAARAGARVRLVGAVGDDDFGAAALQKVRDEGDDGSGGGGTSAGGCGERPSRPASRSSRSTARAATRSRSRPGRTRRSTAPGSAPSMPTTSAFSASRCRTKRSSRARGPRPPPARASYSTPRR